jgi:hypothetical protein
MAYAKARVKAERRVGFEVPQPGSTPSEGSP